MTRIIFCRGCGKPVEMKVQRGDDGETLTLITCTNRADKCNLCGYTFTDTNYFTRDLSRYQWREETWRHDATPR